MQFFLGLDLAKDTFVALLIDERGTVLQQRSFPNSAAGFDELLDWLPNSQQTLALCEPTGVYGKRLQHALASRLGSLHELNAQTLRRFSFSQVQTKTDQADALSIAQAARMLFLSRPEILEKSRVQPNLTREDLALWLNECDRLRDAIARLRNQIAGLEHSPAPTAGEVKQRRHQELQRLLLERKEVIRKIQELYRQLNDQDAACIDSIPGVGPLTTAAALVAIRDIRRFDSADALKAYLGTYPARRQSGLRERPAHVARHGNRLLRHMLWNAARAAVWHQHPQNPFRKLFDHLRAKGKTYGQAIGAVVRKLVQVIYGVLKTKTHFQYPAS